MSSLTLVDICTFVNNNISGFHDARLHRIKSIKLHEILKKKNPYLFKAKNISTASELIQNILDAFISSSEEKMFGDFLEELAVFICRRVYDGRKSAATGIDLEFSKEASYYIVSIKSGPNWGNKGQYDALKNNMVTAKRVLSQSSHMGHVQPVLGICYGNAKTTDNGIYLKISGQNFWHFISNNKELYTDIIEPIGYEAKKHNDDYLTERNRVYNIFTQEFLNEFCVAGTINWNSLVKFNSGNLKES